MSAANWWEWRDAPAADYAVIGDPVAHSLSPRMHAAAYRALGCDWKYSAMRVPLGELSPALEHLESLGYKGVNVTVPLKEAAFRMTNGGDDRMGAVNTVRLADRQAVSTDAPGFLETLTELGVGPTTALLLGAGGTARTLLVALSDAGFVVKVHNRTESKATTMIEAARCPGMLLERPDASGCELIINATSSGLEGHSPELDWDSVPAGAVVYDVSYTNGMTPFLQIASGRGHQTCDGRRMLVAQGALSFEWWTGLKAPREAMLQAVLEHRPSDD